MRKVLKILGTDYHFEYIKDETHHECHDCVLSGRSCGVILDELYKENKAKRPLCGVGGYYNVTILQDEYSKIYIKVAEEHYASLLEDMKTLGYSWRTTPYDFDIDPFQHTNEKQLYLVVEDINKHILYASLSNGGDSTAVITSQDIAQSAKRLSKKNFINFKKIIDSAYEQGAKDVSFIIGGDSFTVEKYKNALLFSKESVLLGVYYITKDYTVRKTSKTFAKLLGLKSGLHDVAVWYKDGEGRDVYYTFIGYVEDYLYLLDNLFPTIREAQLSKMVKAITK